MIVLYIFPAQNYINRIYVIRQQAYMYNPTYDETYKLYDIFYCNDTLYVIRPTLKPGINIRTSDTNETFYTLVCPGNHFHLHYLKTNYCPETKLLINDELHTFHVNVFPSYANKIIMSTLVKREDNYLPQWIEYHKQLGIEHFIIYDNVGSNNATEFDALTHDDIRINSTHTDLENTLKNYIDDGTVIVINWPYPYCLKECEGRAQTLQQNHSLYAFRTAKYIGYFDVDEYINPQEGYSSISAVLDETMNQALLPRDEIGSFSLKNRWFYNPFDYDATGHHFLYIDHCDTITKEGHEKSFVIPENTTSYNIHHSSLGKERVWVDPNLMRFNHYCYLNKKDRGRIHKKIYDTTITSHLKYLGSQSKIVMFLNGGLGNQLFQIASAYSTAKAQNKEFVVRNTLGTNHSPINYFENIFRKIKINNMIECEWYREPTTQFTERLQLPYFKEDTLLFGFFQNENYFIHNRAEILALFQIEPDRETYLELKYPDAWQRGAFIHYRRGDYLSNPNYNIVNDGYYTRAIEKTLKKRTDAIFYVFSDDLDYCRSLDYLIALGNRIIFVDEDDVNSLYLMSKCFYGGIGTNSSYSWWGGWLNTNPDKFVVYPDKWLRDRDDLHIWWKGSLKMRDRPKLYFLTFGGGPMTFLHAVDRLVAQAKSLNIFDHVYGFKEDDLKADPDFWSNHRQFTLMNVRGFGYWIWKAYLIKKVMDEAQEDDVILYCDCGNEIDVRKKDKILRLIEIVKKDLLMATYPGPLCTSLLDEIKWNKRDVLNFFGIEHRDNPVLNTMQRQANPILLCKTPVTESFVNEWNSIGLNNNHYLNDYPSYAENFPEFVEHRHDQSIFSLLSKKYGIFSDTTTEGTIETLRNKTGISQLPY